MTTRLARTGEALVASGTVAAAIVIASLGRRQPALAAVVALAIVWSAAPLVAHLAAGRRRPNVSSTGGEVAVTTVVRLGDEPLDIARTTILLASAQGPTVVAAVGEVAPQLLRLGPPVAVADDASGALAAAIELVSTPAVSLVSGRAVPTADACRRAAGLLGGGVGWVTGRVTAFSRDHYVDDRRDEVSAALLDAARTGGLVTWVPDATVVATELLRQRPVDARRPLGSWLRDAHADGWVGAATTDALARRAAPVDAGAYWPDAVARTWGRSADLAAATTKGSVRARLVAFGLLLRELFVVPIAALAVVPFFVAGTGSVPGRSIALAGGVAGALGVCRWWALRRALGVPLRPVPDLVAGLHSVPGSLLSVGAVVTRRPGAPHRALPERPLVWGALVLTVVTGARLVDAAGRPSDLVVATSLAALAALWAFSMGALAQRNWARTAFRVPLDITLAVDGASYPSLNGSPSGLAVRAPAGRLDGDGRFAVTLRLDDGTGVSTTARVSGRRRVGDGAEETVGLVLGLSDDARHQWVGQLDRAANAAAGRTRPTTIEDDLGAAPRTRSWIDRLTLAVTAVVSVAVVVALVLVLFGIHPLVIRSASMAPSYSTGDVVLSQTVAAADLVVGDVATVPGAVAGGSLTHRVVSVRHDGDELVVATQGDANTTGETVRLAPSTEVGRVRWSVPWVGRPASALRTSPATLLAVAVAAALVVAGLRRRRSAAGTAELDVGDADLV